MNISNFCEATESYVFSSKDYVQYFDKWKPGKSNILYITGLSGSGKSTLAEEFEKKYKAHMFELDGIQHNYDSSDKGILEKCKKKFPEYTDALKTWLKNANGELTKEQFNLLKRVCDYAISLCKQDKNTLYIIEGLQLFQWYNMNHFKSKPLIIKGTSMLKSSMRGLARDNKNDNGNVDLKKLVKELPGRIKWESEDEQRLKQFKKGMESSEYDGGVIGKASHQYYIKNDNGVIMSKLSFYDYSKTVKNFDWILVADVETKPEFRRMGLASKLIKQLYSDITSKNPNKGLYLLVRSDNSSAISLYVLLGFKFVKKCKINYKTYDVMCKGNADVKQLYDRNFS